MIRRLMLVITGLAAFALASPPRHLRADTVYVTSLSTGGLFRFDSANPTGTMEIVSGTGTFVGPSALAFGPDGNLYIGESGDGFSQPPRIRRYQVATGSVSPVPVAEIPGVFPAAIAFQRPADGGRMLIGRSPFFPEAYGPVMALAGWNSGTATIGSFTSGTGMQSSAGLAVAADGTVYAANTTYAGPGAGITGVVQSFDAAGNPIATIAPGPSVPGPAYGPGGLVLDGSTLYSASIQNGAIYATSLTGTTTTEFAATGFPFQVGPLARLSDGRFLAGSVSGGGNIYQFSETGGSPIGPPINFFGVDVSGTFSYFGQVGGIAVVPVPEPATIGLTLVGGAGVAWRLRRRRSTARA